MAATCGRGTSGASGLLGRQSLVHHGNRGLEPRVGGERTPQALGEPVAGLEDKRKDLASQPGLRFEDMGVTISIRSLVTAVPERVEALAEEPVNVPG